MAGVRQYHMAETSHQANQPYGSLRVTVGGVGIWYLYDVCRIGSSPVLTRSSFAVAADLPHLAFVLSVVTLMLILGFAVSMLLLGSNIRYTLYMYIYIYIYKSYI